MREQELNLDQKTKVAKLNEQTWNLTLIVSGPVLSPLNPILPQQPLNNYGAIIQVGQKKVAYLNEKT